MELKKEEQAVFALRSLYEGYGYTPYKMSRFEEYDLYVRNRDFLVSDQIITFSDRSGKLLAMKPDVTLSIIKNAPDAPGSVKKVYYNENVYRSDRSGGTFKEIMQTGLECVGELSGYEIAEVVLLAAKSLALLDGEYVLSLSHMGLVAAVLEGLPEEAKARATTFLRQKNSHELASLCESQGVSGEKLLALVECGGDLNTVEGVLTTDDERSAFAELKTLCQILQVQGCSVRVDFSVGSDLKYYSGVVFKGYLPGIPTGVLSGGQYDKLLRRLGRTSGAIGFAIYLDLLQQRGQTLGPIDTLILYDDAADLRETVAAAETAAERGTILVTRRIPEDRTWRGLIDLRGGVEQ